MSEGFGALECKIGEGFNIEPKRFEFSTVRGWELDLGWLVWWGGDVITGLWN